MPLDSYSLCPGGTGKKIKFCCGDLVTELQKVQRMLEGEQRAACLDYIEKLDAKTPGRACLLSVKTMLEAGLGRPEQADKTLASFLELYPGNAVALAEAAQLAIYKRNPGESVNRLQDALESCGTQIPAQVFEAIGNVAAGLLNLGQILPARGHLMLMLGVGSQPDQRAMDALMQVNASPRVPLLLKQDLSLQKASDDAGPWKQEVSVAIDLAGHGQFRKAAAALEAALVKSPDEPIVWRNLAILRSWLTDVPGMVAALHKYASLNVTEEDAVEAEALAQLLDVSSYTDMVEIVASIYTINDMEQLIAQFGVNKRCAALPPEMTAAGSENGPPPRTAYWLLDRPDASTGKQIARADVPRILGQAFLFGRQTDREARLELMAYRGTELDAARQLVVEVAGPAISAEPQSERVASSVGVVPHAMSWNWRLPPDTPMDLRLKLVADERQDVLMNKWPTLKLAMLGDQSAEEAAQDAGRRIAVMAAILNLELTAERTTAVVNFNELRRKLNLPELGPVDPPGGEIDDVPLVRLARLNLANLSDDNLLDAYRRADYFSNLDALKMLATEITKRESVYSKVDLAETYGVLAQLETDTVEALRYLDEARKAADSAGSSTASWDLAELTLRIARGELHDADRLLNHIRNEHLREPGVAEALHQVLVEAGVISPDGRPNVPMNPQEASVIVSPDVSTSSGGKLWTPGAEAAPAAGKKSAIWTPGD